MQPSEPAFLADLNRRSRSKYGQWTFDGEQTLFAHHRVRSYRLGNGLRVLLAPDDELGTVSFHSWIGVGSRHETPGKTGIAHLFEHLMFGATRNHPLGEFDRLLEEVGGETNAATWADWTSYYDNVPAGQLELVVELESDRLARLRLGKEALDSEKEVVANERRYRVDDDVNGAAEELLYLTALGNTPYGRPTIGFMADIESFTLKDCQAFYKQYYAPSALTLVVAGRFSEVEALRLIGRSYGTLKPATTPRDPRVPKVRQRAERQRVFRAPTQLEKLHLAYHGPALGTEDWLGLELLNEVLVGGSGARWVEEFVMDREIATDVEASHTPFRYPGLWEFSMGLRTGQNGKETLVAVDRAIERVTTKGVTRREVEEAKNRIELAYWSGMVTPYGRADQLGFFSTVLDDPCAGPKRLARLQKLGPRHLREVAQRYFDRARRTVLRVEAS